MLMEARLERVFGLSQLFAKRRRDGSISLLFAKVTDNFLIGGSVQAIMAFIDLLTKPFIVGKTVVDKKAYFDGCEIEQSSDGSIRMSMLRYLERLKSITVSRNRRRKRDEKATDEEVKQYSSLASTLMYLGNGVSPQASYVTLLLQQMVTKVHVEQLVMTNEMLNEVMKLNPWIMFKVPARTSIITEFIVSTFADASFNQTSTSGYGQTGFITGLRVMIDGGMDFFHRIDWCSSKQRRVSYSPHGADLACAVADDGGYYVKSGLKGLFAGTKTRSELFTDWRCLYDTITTLHEGREHRLRTTVQFMRNCFDSRELDLRRWIPGTVNSADARTNRNPKI